ncbi:MAG TPA: hypothetical protein VNY55_13410, partial [Mycobacterium sp.]|nr:hypothetical protein [Mycobacterium sp.]
MRAKYLSSGATGPELRIQRRSDMPPRVGGDDRGSQAGFNWSSQHLDYLEVWGGVREAAVG